MLNEINLFLNALDLICSAQYNVIESATTCAVNESLIVHLILPDPSRMTNVSSNKDPGGV